MRYVLAIALALLSLTAVAQENSSSVESGDDSDWWSTIRSDETDWSKVKWQKIRTPDSSLEIAGISLREEKDQAKHIIQKLGPTTEVSRGDASTGRSQLCYFSRDHRTHLIFEFGEVEAVFYLFRAGRPWNGEKDCATSAAVKATTSTRSGLRLGMSRAQVEAVLGKPSVVSNGRVVYFRSIPVKSTPEQLKRARVSAPDMPAKEFLETYGQYDMTTYIEARFKNGKMNYLAISESETS